MLAELESFDWAAHVQPSWNAPGEIVRALHELSTATSATGNARYCRLLYAVGNNHSGSYFPVVLAVVPFLGRILEEGGSVARARTLDVLIDLLESFGPEAGFELVETSHGARLVAELLRKEVSKLQPIVQHIAQGGEAEAAELARYLLTDLAGVAS